MYFVFINIHNRKLDLRTLIYCVHIYTDIKIFINKATIHQLLSKTTCKLSTNLDIIKSKNTREQKKKMKLNKNDGSL